MCYQIPDQLILDNREITIAPLPVAESAVIIRTPEQTLSLTTAHVRGYIATWALIDEKLYLIKIDGCYKLQHNLPVLADWINTTICSADGIYGENIDIEIKSGLIVTE
jgi:hypothetical protein